MATIKLPNLTLNKNLLSNVLAITLIIGVSGSLVWIGYLLSNKLSRNDKQSITVTGTAISDKSNKIATFSANITTKNLDKKKAVEELNTTSNTVMEAIKKFGIDAKDIKTNYFNVYQNSEWNPTTQQSKMTDWSANVTVDVKLRDVTKAGEFGTLLATLDTSYINGPNFTLDPDQAKNNDLLKAAIEDAKAKAENMAITTGRKLGKVLKIDETNGTSEIMPMLYKGAVDVAGDGSTIPMEAGTSEASKSVTVTFELK